MSLTAAAIRLMADKGLSASDIADIAEANDAPALAVDEQAERRRAADRERKRLRKICGTSADAPPNDIYSNPPEDSSPASPPKKSSPRDPFPCPDGVDPSHWRDLRANRKAKRLKDTPTAHDGLLRSLAELSDDEWPPGRLVKHAAERGWGAIFDPRDRKNGQQHHRIERQAEGANPLAAEAMRRLGRTGFFGLPDRPG